MDAQTLREAMGGSLPLARYAQLLPAFNSFLVQAGCTTVNRAAMACAQLGHESVGLKYAREIASGKAYNGRKDLGNTQPGDGPRFRGAGWIQTTGRHNFTAVSRWAHGKGYVPSPTYFVDRPDELAADRFVWIGPVWYWTVARPQINELCDRGDLVGVTRAINGGTNGLADRRTRWNRCRGLGNRILPSGSAAPAPAPSGGAGPGSIPELVHGATGSAVRHLQQWLNATFPAYSSIDLGPARYGPATTSVLAEFQRRSGVRGGDGRNLGPQTRAALWAAGYRPPGTAAPAPAPVTGPVPVGPPPEGEQMFVKTPEPAEGQPKREWPTVRVPLSFEPGSGLLKVDHGGRGGWIHLGRWWVRGKAWTPNVPIHEPQDHPVGANGSERFVGYGWVTGAPAGADMIELVLSAPDGVHIQWWRSR